MATTSNCLIIGSAGVASFAQQGQVDWVAFGNTVWKASSDVLQRFALADIQPITFGAGIVLAGQFRLSAIGQQRVEDAIARLEGVSVLRDVLWLGFGYRSLINTMANTVGGIKCVALCSALADVHSENSAAKILTELWKQSAYPTEYEPSHSQFLALVKTCAGVLVKTPFMATVDVMLGDMLWKVPDGAIDEIPVASNLQDIARALRGLFQLSRGEVDNITVTGGGECAFFAALAYWLFDFKIEVIDNEGNLIFTSTPENVSVQLYVRYGHVRNDAIQVPSTTYVLGDCREVFDRNTEEGDRVFIVRTPWDGCLRRTFGAAFLAFTESPLPVAAYLGSLARIYAALARAEPVMDTLSRHYYVDFVEASRGQGFIDTILKTFPELERVDGLQENMEGAAEKSFGEALMTVQSSVQILETQCKCFKCSEANGQTSTQPDLTRSCLVGIAYAVREVARTMASVVFDSQDERPLLPSVEGIKAFSRHGKGEKLMRVLVQHGTEVGVQRSDKASFAHFALGLCEKEDEGSFRFHPLFNASLLFQGPGDRNRILNSVHMTYTALSERGVCCYVDSLRSLTCQAELVRMVHILPGHISHKGRQYMAVRDFQHTRDKPIPDFAQVTPASVAIREDNLALLENQIVRIEILANAQDLMEKAICCSYKIYTPTASFNLHPGLLMMQILIRSGQIPCGNGPQCRKQLALPCSIVQSGWQLNPNKTQNLEYSLRVACCIWPSGDDMARCIALQAHIIDKTGPGQRYTAFVRRRECLPCCTLAVLKEGGKIVPGESPETRHVAHII
ncbi:hypothetical protein MMC30_002875 [Trapelia coarctata]|nr:hypothetical protein [Trapelia coarctata]